MVEDPLYDNYAINISQLIAAAIEESGARDSYDGADEMLTQAVGLGCCCLRF